MDDIVGEDGLNFLDALSGELRLSRLHRPRHHVDVRVIPLVVKGGIPAEVTGRDVHLQSTTVCVHPYSHPQGLLYNHFTKLLKPVQ